MDFIQVFQDILGSYIVAGAIILCGIGVLIWKLASRSQSVSDKLDALNTLPCSHHDIRLNSHEGLLSDSRTTLSEMKGQLDLLVKLSTAARTKPLIIATEEYSEKLSPRKLNKNGQSLYQDINGEKFLNDNLATFFAEIDKLNPKTALDVENFALSILRASSSDDIFIPLKSWVYNAPTRQIEDKEGELTSTEVSMDDIFFVLSLPLRDKYLEQNPSIIK